jgi:phosphomannomutase
MTVALDPGIFKAYDVRGIYGEQFDGEIAQQIGRAFARVLGELSRKPVDTLRIGIGRDMRLTAPQLAARYRDGILAEGADVLDVGQVGTEMLYWLVGSRSLDGGLMCTASHNPKAYTGAKLVREGALALSGETGIQDIRRLIEAGLPEPSAQPGSAQELNIYAEFQEAALRFIDPDQIKPMTVVLDGGNGMAGPTVGPLLQRLPLTLIETYWTPDGNFPDHEPNPLLPENRAFIVEQVRASKADLGIAFDGDADRCFFIDEHGEFVDGDFLTALLSQALLAKNPDPSDTQTILYDVRASWAVPHTVRASGGRPQINRVGHAFFKSRMKQEGSLFGGEVSGHYYFRDFYCADSGTLPALLVLEHLSKTGKTMSQLLSPLRERYFISGEINSEVSDQQGKMEQIAERYADAKQSRLDGISIDYEDWHFNVRPSNTEPLLRLCLESLRSKQDMERRRDEVLELIRS